MRQGPSFLHQTGFTYLAILALVAILGTVLGATAEVWHTTMQRDKERELLFVGHQYQRAIERYYVNSPPGIRQYPTSLDDLLLDPRYPDIRRYLRRIWVDPMTGQANWELIRDPNNGIVALHSQSDEHPIKVGNFEPDDKAFENAEHYSDWIFLALPGKRNLSTALADVVPKQN